MLWQAGLSRVTSVSVTTAHGDTERSSIFAERNSSSSINGSSISHRSITPLCFAKANTNTHTQTVRETSTTHSLYLLFFPAPSSSQHALVSPGPGAPPALPPTASSTPPPSSSSSSSSEPGSSISNSHHHHHHHHHHHQHQHQQLSSVPSSVSSVAFSSFLKCCCLRRASVAPRLQSFMAITANVVSSEVWEQNKKYTVYKIVVKYDSHTWIIHRRYNEFSKLCDLLKKLYPHLHLKLPGKKLFGNNFSSDFIKTRRQALDTLVQRVLGEPQVLDVAEVRTFFQLDRTLKNSVEDDDDHEDASMTITSNSSEKMINLGPSEKPSVKPSDFEFLRTIGKGSFGKVFSARHKKEDTIYAIKVLNKKMILKRNEKNHIMSERNVLLKNLNHPFLVGLYYSFQTKDKLYFVLDYVNGGELFFHLSKERLFTEPRARFYAAEITSAIGYLHSQGIIYRDLKPENILLDSDGHIILTDFGLCKEGLRERETTNTFCGTPEYLAPEVLRKEPYDRCVDWWCLGAVLYEMLNSLPPFYSRDNAEMYDNILHKPVRFRANMSTAARNILELLLQKDKRKRLGAIEDADEIKRHEFFRPINWADLESKSIPPPFNPNVKDNLDMRNIDPEFVREAIPNSVIKSQGMGASSLGDNVFQGFSYAPVHNHNLGY